MYMLVFEISEFKSVIFLDFSSDSDWNFKILVSVSAFDKISSFLLFSDRIKSSFSFFISSKLHTFRFFCSSKSFTNSYLSNVRSSIFSL